MTLNKEYLHRAPIDRRSLASNKVAVAYGIAFLLFALGGLAAPGFFSVSHLMTILGLSAFLGIIALAQMIVIVAGSEGIDLSVGAVISMGAVLGAKYIDGQDANLAVGIAVVLLSGGIVGVLNGTMIAFLNIPALVMTLAMSGVVSGFLIVHTGGQPSGSASPLVTLIGSGRAGIVPFIVLVWAAVLAATLFLIKKTKCGALLHGVGSNPVTARLSGVDTRLVRTVAYAMSGIVSAFAGLCLLGYTGTPYLDLGSMYVMPSVAAVVIGGVSLSGGSGSYLGVIAGTIILTTLNSLLVALRSGEGGRQIVYGIVILVVLKLYSNEKR